MFTAVIPDFFGAGGGSLWGDVLCIFGPEVGFESFVLLLDTVWEFRKTLLNALL